MAASPGHRSVCCIVATTSPVCSCRSGDVAVQKFICFSPYPARERGNLADMQIAMVGLGRMGANMVRRLQRAGHDCVAYDLNPAAVQAIEAEGARGAGTPQQVVDALAAPRHIWLMVPAAYVGSTIDAFAPLLSPGDTLIDGGNSWYRDDVERAGPLREKGINYLDVGYQRWRVRARSRLLPDGRWDR